MPHPAPSPMSGAKIRLAEVLRPNESSATKRAFSSGRMLE